MAKNLPPLPFRIGVISDTHGYLDPRVPELFQGVNHILHAGDIGWASIVLELEDIAPTTAITGNTDEGLAFNETEEITLVGIKFLLHHIVDIHRMDRRLENRIRQKNPRVIVFGHTHQSCAEEHEGRLFFNSGYSGKPKYNQPRSVAILQIVGSEITYEFLAL